MGIITNLFHKAVTLKTTEVDGEHTIHVITEAADGDSDASEVNQHVMTSVGSQQLTVTTSAVVTLTVPATAKRVLIYVGGTAEEAVNWLADGTDPTGTKGIEVVVGDYIDLTDLRIDYSTLMAAMEFIGKTGNTGNITLEVMYFN